MKKKLIWLAATLVLGALGSGLWELAFRPMLASVGTAALGVVTLGLESLRDGLYEEAARGQYERVSIALLSAGAGLLAGVTTGVLLIPTWRRRQQPDQERAAGSRRFQRGLILVFMTTMALLLFQRTAYINRAANHFDQLANIVAPQLKDDQRLKFRARFAQVRTRAEYLAVINELRAIASSNGLYVPEFTVY